jgi:hypothetical protein
MERQRDESSEVSPDDGPVADAHNALNYLAPRDDVPRPTGGDVIQGAVAVCVAVGCCLGVGGLIVLALQNARYDWAIGQYIAWIVCIGFALFGAAAAVRSARYYIAGKHRLRKAAPPSIGDNPVTPAQTPSSTPPSPD